ncbi:cytochrome c oxidase subunit CcoM [Vreelandella aquamarina]
MYWDDTIIFGLATVALMIVFMIGWVGFIVRDHRRKKGNKSTAHHHESSHHHGAANG